MKNTLLYSKNEISEKALSRLMKEVAMEAREKALESDKKLIEIIKHELSELIKKRNA